MDQHRLDWIARHGYPAIFALLVLGIVGLPVPDETLLTFTGYLIWRHEMQAFPAFLSALSGSMCGITISYALGRTFGITLLHRFGRYLHLDETKINRAHEWFEHVGRWALTFGYFVPGIRHLTAYAAGISELETHWFAVFAYGGALLWTSTFIALGYFLGEQWEAVLRQVHRNITGAALIAAALILLYLAWRKWFRKR